MAGCAADGGCPSDYIAVGISALSVLLLLARSILPFALHKVSRRKGSAFWIPMIQVLASINLVLSLVLSLNFLKFKKRHWWQSCYVWGVWMEGPLGFGLLLSCRIVQAFQLYFIVGKKRLPPLRSHISLPLFLLPWFAGAARVWIASYSLNEVHEEIGWLQVLSRFVLLTTTSVLVVVFFSFSSSQPLISQISLRRREALRCKTMGQALGIPDSGLLLRTEANSVIDPKEPLEKLLLDKRFRQSFLAFADSCLAGESMHFYEDVHELGKIPADDSIRRIYMARDIIDKYIVEGSPMEVNISHRCRKEILTTTNLAHPHLFSNALNELLQLMKMNLARDYWSSMFSLKFKEEANKRPNSYELEQMSGWNFSPRLSTVHGSDNPFPHDHLSRGSDHNNNNFHPS